MASIKLGKNIVGDNTATYFIADISANHDGDLERAKMLIHLAAESGADAAKFQNFKAHEIVSDIGFKTLGAQQAHQAKWKKSVTEVYHAAELPWQWTATLKKECEKAGIAFFSAPYDFGAVDMLDEFVDMYKIGSGDITWLEIITKIAKKNKPVLLACGASSLNDIQRAMDAIIPINSQICLMQCNTNYTANLENFKYINLNVLKTFKLLYPDVVLGLSDHTPGHATTLGAVALGARVIEKHFTDDTSREGPDHPFSMDAKTWKEMVERTRELEFALGSAIKKVEANEAETVVVQRRSLRLATDLDKDTIIQRNMLSVLRPAPADGIPPYEIDKVLGKKLRQSLTAGTLLKWDLID